MIDEDELLAWFRDDLLPEIVREGRFPTGKNPKIADCKFESTERFTDHFASSPYFLDLTIDSDDGRKVLSLLVKFSSQDDRLMKLMNLDRQFRNEVMVYGKLLNEFREVLLKNPKISSDLIDQLVPKCYYARYDEENPKKSLLVFENQRSLGFRTADSKIYLDYEHSVIVMRQLGRFHALSLSMKISYPEVLQKMKESLIETRYFDDPSVVEECRAFNGICNQRGVDYLLSLNSPKVPRDYLLSMKEMLSHPFPLFRRLISPKESLALLCHGDYCRNNLLFRYEENRVVDAKMFDFQTMRYANPSIDLAFFFYLNTTLDLREKHLEELMEIYHSSLISTTAAILDLPESDISHRYPLKLFTDDFAEHAVYGYSLAAFFIAVMACGRDIDWNMSTEERGKFLAAVGGEDISKNIADILLDFYKRGFYVS